MAQRPLAGRKKSSRSRGSAAVTIWTEEIRLKKRWGFDEDKLLSLLGGGGGHYLKLSLMAQPGTGKRALSRAMPWTGLAS